MDHIEEWPIGHYCVDLQKGWCGCGKFQAFCVSCSQVITACCSVCQKAFLHLSDIYNVVNLFNVYNERFLVLFNNEYWTTYQEGVIFHNENMCRKKKDRPNNTHIGAKMDIVDKLLRKYGLRPLNDYT